MNASERHQFFQRALLIAWGMFTLVLVFCIVFLVAQMISQGKSPLDVAILEEGGILPDDTADVDNSARSVDITLYFAASDGRLLVPEMRRIEFDDSLVENCHRVLNALIDGPRDILHPIMSRSTRIRGVFLLKDGELVVDFSRELELEHPRSASAELLFVYGVVDSLTQNVLVDASGASVKKVRFVFEGSPPTESFPAHFDLTDPIWPDPQWIAPATGASAAQG